MSITPRELDTVIPAREQSEGVGARVRRCIGSGKLPRLDPFLLLDEFKGEWPNGFPDHPHRGFETVSYMLQGTFSHEDFTGAVGTLEVGDVQWMTAGRGIVHSEIPGKGVGPVRGLQLWVNLKSTNKMCAPRYQEKRASELPSKKENGVKVVVLAGESMGICSPIQTLTPTYYMDFTLDGGAKFSQPVPSHWNAAFYVIEGSVKTGSQLINTHELALFRLNSCTDVIFENNSADQSARLILIAGEPLNEPVVQHGPFVMNTQEEIAQTFNDYRSGTNGFENTSGWKSKQGTEALRAKGY